MEVFICDWCGLMQSFSSKIYTSNPPPSMSCDADRASIRYTKDLIIESHMKQIESQLKLRDMNCVLDIGSNRGAFIKKFISINSLARIDAIEPEPSVSHFLNENSRITKRITRFEFVDLTPNSYDFIYIAHSLEHLISASASLLKIYNLLKLGGYAFIAVPNMESITAPYFEEQFIDTHTFHFTEKILATKLGEIGFKATSMTMAGSDEICIMAEKVINKEIVGEKVEVTELIAAFREYPIGLNLFREELKRIGEDINTIFAGTQVIYWGAGRIFDGLIKIGGINVENIECLVDKTLSMYMDRVHGLQILAPSELENVDRTTPIIVCSREYAEQISSDATILGFTDIRNFMDFGATKI